MLKKLRLRLRRLLSKHFTKKHKKIPIPRCKREMGSIPVVTVTTNGGAMVCTHNHSLSLDTCLDCIRKRDKKCPK